MNCFKKHYIYKISSKLLFVFLLINISFFAVKIKEIKLELIELYFKKEYKYFCCYSGIMKKENLYAREFVQYYHKLGVDQFFIGDNNDVGTEKLMDVLNDYVENGIVEITNLMGKPRSINFHRDFIKFSYNRHKSECNWFIIDDIDEFLTFTDKNMTIKSYLANKVFDKCDVIKINWLIYGDNELVNYDRRTMVERFTKPDYSNIHNVFIKSIVRGDILEPLWVLNANAHGPNRKKRLCNSLGQKIRYTSCSLIPPIWNVSYIKHFRTKTAEEYAYKLLRGYPHGGLKINHLIDIFFMDNKYSDEKLEVLEKILNMTFEKYHKKK